MGHCKKRGDEIEKKDKIIKAGYYQSKDLIGNSSEGTTSVMNTLIIDIDRRIVSESSAYSLVFQQDPDTFQVNMKRLSEFLTQATGGSYLSRARSTK
jgi:hypothetical protein